MASLPKIIVTGGAGFIGSAVCRYLVKTNQAHVINVDKLTYAANLDSLAEIEKSENYNFEKVDICDYEAFSGVLNKYKPEGILHLAAESHVDRSIGDASEFIKTNIMGTYTLLEACRNYMSDLPEAEKAKFKFLHVSTDEVYGSLGDNGLFEETTPYDPSSPYSSSKASADLLVNAWVRTYNFPAVMTNCSNNYGPFHFPEKLIPLMIINCINHQPLPVYGEGKNIRDWLYVDDHAKAIWLVWQKGKIGEKYNVGGFNERTNIDVVKTICNIMNQKNINKPAGGFESLIKYVTDRPGHDARYAIDSTKITKELGWKAEENFDTGILKTIDWYLENQSWWEPLLEKTKFNRFAANATKNKKAS